MRISINWLKEFINISLTNEEISDKLTMLGLESEAAYNTSSLGNIVIGEIKDIIKHPNADKLNLCKVYDGKNTLPVVCGAPNVKVGQKIAFAPVGSILPGNFKINKAKIRGEVSQGMICSEKEVNISDEHDGIMVLDVDATPGDTFINYLNNNLGALELDITPNRPDCFSHLGVARDLAAKLNIDIHTPSYDKKSFSKNIVKDMINISLEDPEDCPRYIAGIVKDVNVGPSPDWLKRKLESTGQRSINNVVDISNLVLLEMGQPSHIFDYDKIDSKQILIRRANKNEKIKTLDEETRFLSADELLITNGKKPIAIAGIMGGLSTSVNDKSSTLLIECAYFNPPVIRKGSKNLSMSTEASKRFERGADPDGTEKAMWRIIQLLEDVANGVWIPGIVDLYPKKIKQDSIKLRRLKLDILSGCKIPDGAVKESLTNLGCTVKKNDGEWICKPPSWRPDIKREVDLIEEVVRLYGYDNIPSNLNYQGIMNDGIIDPHRSLSKIINILTGFGFNQIFSNSLQSSRKISALNFKSVKMLNPLSDKMSEMRTSLFQGLLDTANFNFKNGNHDMMLFEWGNVFEQEAEGLEGIKEKLYLSGLAHGFYLKSSVHSDESLPASFHLIKGIVGALFSRLKINDINYDKFEDISIGLEDTHTVKVDSKIIGYIGKLSSKFDNLLNLAIGESYGFQFDLIQLMKLADIKNEYKPVVVYPSMIRDLNFVLDETIPVGEIIHVINKNGKNILIDSEPVSIFRDSSIGDNNKAVAINLIFQSSKKTLEDKDVNPVINEIIRVVSKKFSAKLR